MKKLQKFFAMFVVFSMCMSLLSVTVFAEETETENSVFGCEKIQGQLLCEDVEHTHDDECYESNLVCSYEEKVCEIQLHSHEDACYELNCSKNATTLECTATEHIHGDGCYTYIAHNCDESCPEGCTQEGSSTLSCSSDEYKHTADCYHSHGSACYNLICDVTEHAHTDDCNHAHGADCWAKMLKCEILEHTHGNDCYHTHNRDCLTDEAEADVDAVIKQMTEAPKLEDMQAARGNTFADTKTYPADQAAEDYNAYIKVCKDARGAALQAYRDMPAELKDFVPEALVTKLTAELETVFTPMSKSVIKGENGYMFQSVYEPGYEKSHHVFKATGKNNAIPELLILVDASDNYTWTPSGLYSSGSSNYEVVYCCDMETLFEDGVHYKRMNLEEGEYYSDAAAEQIRGIVTSSYPYVSLEDMKKDLKGKVNDAENLTRGDVIAAVQFAIWSCANSDHVDGYSYNTTFDITNYNKDWGRVLHDYANEMYEWWNVGKGTYYTNETARDRIDSLVTYLSGLSGVQASNDQIVITGVEIVGVKPVLMGDSNAYEVALKVVLNSSGSGEKDKLTLTAIAGSGEDATVTTKDVVYGQTEYMLLVTANPNDEIVVEISGTQNVPQGVYFYAPEPADVDPDESDDEIGPDGIPTAREVSQNMVGVAMGDTPVYAMKSVLFEMDIPEDPASATLNLLKVNETGKPLADAEFALATDLDGDETPDIFATYITDADGKAVIEGLIPDVEYVLTETKAPAGYDPITGEIEFVVEQDGQVLDMVFNLPNGVTCDTPEDEQYVLTVVNCETPSGGGGGGNGGGGGGGGSIIIPEDPVPLTPIPEEPVIIPEEPEFEEILDEEIPLADVPKTSDASTLWLALSALSGTSLAGVSLLGRKKREEI